MTVESFTQLSEKVRAKIEAEAWRLVSYSGSESVEVTFADWPNLLPTRSFVAILRGVVHGLGIRRDHTARFSA